MRFCKKNVISVFVFLLNLFFLYTLVTLKKSYSEWKENKTYAYLTLENNKRFLNELTDKQSIKKENLKSISEIIMEKMDYVSIKPLSMKSSKVKNKEGCDIEMICSLEKAEQIFSLLMDDSSESIVFDYVKIKPVQSGLRVSFRVYESDKTVDYMHTPLDIQKVCKSLREKTVNVNARTEEVSKSVAHEKEEMYSVIDGEFSLLGSIADSEIVSKFYVKNRNGNIFGINPEDIKKINEENIIFTVNGKDYSVSSFF